MNNEPEKRYCKKCGRALIEFPCKTKLGGIVWYCPQCDNKDMICLHICGHEY